MVEPRQELMKLSDYVPGKSIEEIQEHYHLNKVIKLASNENPMGPSPKAKEAFLKISETLHLYPRGDAPNLISALASKYNVKEKQIIIGNGSDEIIDMIGKAYIRPLDNCIGVTPTFSVYEFTTLSNGAEFIGIGEGDKKISLEGLLKRVNSKTRVIFICNPNNPTGHYYSKAELLDFLERVPKNVLVFLDEAYSEFANAADFSSMIPFVEKYDNLFVNRTFSKIYGLAGLRIGYGISSQRIVSNLWKIKPPFDVNQGAQVAAVAALTDDEHIQKTRELNEKGKIYLTQSFSDFNFKVLPTEANFICVHIGNKASDFVEFLEKNGMIIRHLKSFSMPEYVRITVGTEEENRCLISLLKKWVGENK